MIKKNNTAFINIINKIIILACLSFILGCNLQSYDEDEDIVIKDNTKAIIVTIDGLSFVNTLALGITTIQSDDNYLRTNLLKLINSESIRSYTWNGDAGDTAALLASSGSGYRKFLIDNYNEAKSKNKAFIVVSHSWGTFLSYLALSLEPQIECDLFITLSCPLGTASGLPASAEKIVRDYTDLRLTEMTFNVLGTAYPNTKVFYNFMANGDLISGNLSGKITAAANVIDVQVDQGISDHREVADTYFWHKFTTLGDEVVNNTDPNYAVYTAYLITILPLPYDINPTRNDFINQVVTLIQTASGY